MILHAACQPQRYSGRTAVKLEMANQKKKGTTEAVPF